MKINDNQCERFKTPITISDLVENTSNTGDMGELTLTKASDLEEGMKVILENEVERIERLTKFGKSIELEFRDQGKVITKLINIEDQIKVLVEIPDTIETYIEISKVQKGMRVKELQDKEVIINSIDDRGYFYEIKYQYPAVVGSFSKYMEKTGHLILITKNTEKIMPKPLKDVPIAKPYIDINFQKVSSDPGIFSVFIDSTYPIGLQVAGLYIVFLLLMVASLILGIIITFSIGDFIYIPTGSVPIILLIILLVPIIIAYIGLALFELGRFFLFEAAFVETYYGFEIGLLTWGMLAISVCLILIEYSLKLWINLRS